MENSCYQPQELQKVFEDVLLNLKSNKYKSERIRVLENLCKDFLQVIIEKRSRYIRLKNLCIENIGDNVSSFN